MQPINFRVQAAELGETQGFPPREDRVTWWEEGMGRKDSEEGALWQATSLWRGPLKPT